MKLLNKAQKAIASLSLGLGLFAFAGMANAALPLAVTTAFGDLLTDVLAVIDLAWTVVVPVTVGFILIRMFKKGAASAT